MMLNQQLYWGTMSSDTFSTPTDDYNEELWSNNIFTQANNCNEEPVAHNIFSTLADNFTYGQ